MKKSFLVSVVVASVLLIQVASAQDVQISSYGFYGGLDANNRVVNSATVIWDDEPLGFFTTANPKVYFYIEFKTLKAPFELMLKWVDPNGKEINYPIRNSQQGVLRDVWFWWSITLNEESTLGVWHVILTYNNQKIVESDFIVQTPQNIVTRITELLEQNERLEVDLEKAVKQVELLETDLEKTNLMLKQANEEKTKLQAETSELKQSLSKALTDLDQARSINKQLSEQLTAERNKASELENQRMLLIATNVVVAVVAAAAVVVTKSRKPSPPPPPRA